MNPNALFAGKNCVLPQHTGNEKIVPIYKGCLDNSGNILLGVAGE